MGSTNYWVAHKTISQKEADATMFSLQNRVNDDRVSARDAPFQSDPGSCNSACAILQVELALLLACMCF